MITTTTIVIIPSIIILILVAAARHSSLQIGLSFQFCISFCLESRGLLPSLPLPSPTLHSLIPSPFNGDPWVSLPEKNFDFADARRRVSVLVFCPLTL